MLSSTCYQHDYPKPDTVDIYIADPYDILESQWRFAVSLARGHNLKLAW